MNKYSNNKNIFLCIFHVYICDDNNNRSLLYTYIILFHFSLVNITDLTYSIEIYYSPIRIYRGYYVFIYRIV